MIDPNGNLSQRLSLSSLLRLTVALSLVVSLALIEICDASVNLPLHHWAYDAIERLAALGIIDRAMVGTKPYSRTEAARYVARGIERIKQNQVSAELGEGEADLLMARLSDEFRRELRGRSDQGGDAKSRADIRYGARVTTEVDAFSVGGGQTVRFRENRGGEYYANGVQNQTDVRGWLEIGDWASVMAQPKFISNRHALGFGATNNSHNDYLREFSAKIRVFNVALEVGRGTLWWGQGYHGSLLLTDHAFPMDMIKLGSEEAFRLPSLLSALGEWKINSFLARLERDRDFSRANLFGLRVSYLPTSWLELNATRLTQFGGKGRGQEFPDAVLKAYGNPPNQSGAAEVNEQVMVDLRARVPSVPYLIPFPGGLQLYGELASEDKWSKYPLPSRAAILGGIYIPQLFAGDSTDLRIEYADTDLVRRKTEGNPTRVWYNNGTYASGMRHKGLPLGHHMGTDGIDWFVRATRYAAEAVQIGLTFNVQERDRGQPVHERKHEVGLDATWWLSPRARLNIGYTYQKIRNPGQVTQINPFVETFAPNVIAKNHLLGTSLTVDF